MRFIDKILSLTTIKHRNPFKLTLEVPYCYDIDIIGMVCDEEGIPIRNDKAVIFYNNVTGLNGVRFYECPLQHNDTLSWDDNVCIRLFLSKFLGNFGNAAVYNESCILRADGNVLGEFTFGNIPDIAESGTIHIGMWCPSKRELVGELITYPDSKSALRSWGYDANFKK